jgi:hypothetical protein
MLWSTGAAVTLERNDAVCRVEGHGVIPCWCRVWTGGLAVGPALWPAAGSNEAADVVVVLVIIYHRLVVWSPAAGGRCPGRAR